MSQNNNHHPRRLQQGDLLDSEVRLRNYVAKQQLRAMKELASLSSHSAADKGRRNRDWKSNNGSADLNIIPDSMTLEGRARQMVRDSWLAKSIVRSYKRNIAGRGISITPHAKTPDGKPFIDLNIRAQREFGWWARTKDACDLERKQTFGQMQRLAVAERATVGEHFWEWTYAPPLKNGRPDKSFPVGLKIQRFEPEQLDYRILSFQGNEVRGGVELDENGAAVAYHFFTRNPNDYLFRRSFWSRRVPRERVWHYCDQERVLQTRGVTPLTPVMQDIRDHQRHKEAKLWRRIMEACIGMIFRKPYPTPAGSPLTIGPFQSADPNGQTNSGMRTADYVPGMVVEALPGEEVDSFSPQPTSGDDEYSDQIIQGIGAGVGISFGQIARRSDSNYSAARQDMLEDRKEWEPEQDLLVDDLLRPTYELWLTLAAMEGRFDDVKGFDIDEFMADRVRYCDAEYIPPPQTWIDPEKEANAFAVLLKNRLITREEIVTLRGQRFYQVIQKIAAEQTMTDELELPLPENEGERTDLRNIIKAGLTQAVTALEVSKWTDWKKTLDNTGVSTLKSPNPIELPPAPAQQPTINGKPMNGKPINGQSANGRLSEQDAPNYEVSSNPVEKCATCSFIVGNHCSKFDFDVNPEYVCDSWAATPIDQAAQGAKSQPPGPMEGEPPMERNFFPSADKSPPM